MGVFPRQIMGPRPGAIRAVIIHDEDFIIQTLQNPFQALQQDGQIIRLIIGWQNDAEIKRGLKSVVIQLGFVNFRNQKGDKISACTLNGQIGAAGHIHREDHGAPKPDWP